MAQRHQSNGPRFHHAGPHGRFPSRLLLALAMLPPLTGDAARAVPGTDDGLSRGIRAGRVRILRDGGDSERRRWNGERGVGSPAFIER